LNNGTRGAHFMARPVILAVDGDSQVLSVDSGEKALDILGKLELRGDPIALDSSLDGIRFVVRPTVERRTIEEG
jgi:hypothetical protein